MLPLPTSLLYNNYPANELHFNWEDYFGRSFVFTILTFQNEGMGRVELELWFFVARAIYSFGPPPLKK